MNKYVKIAIVIAIIVAVFLLSYLVTGKKQVEFINNEEMRKRDYLVLRFAKENNIPIVWNLAGGYQETIKDGSRSIQKVLDIHNATMEETIKIFCD